MSEQEVTNKVHQRRHNRNQVRKDKNSVNTSIPNWVFDMEYSTQTKKEMLYLKEHGIEPCFRKKTSDYDVTTYKYKKTPELFRVVADYYEQVQFTKQMDSLREQMKQGMTEQEFIEKVIKNG